MTDRFDCRAVPSTVPSGSRPINSLGRSMYDTTLKRQEDYACVRDHLRIVMDALDLLVEPLAAVHVNVALEIVLAKMPLK